jgi:hypothetical protein
LCEQKHAISGSFKFVWADVCNICYLEVCVSRSMQYQVPWSLCEQMYAMYIAYFCSHELQGTWYCILLLTRTSRYQILHASAHTNFKVPDIAYICSHKFQGTRYCMLLLTQTSRYLILHASAHTNFKVPDIAYILCEQMYTMPVTLKFVWAEACNIWYLEVCVSRCIQCLLPWSLCEQKHAISGTLKFVWADVCNVWSLKISVSRSMQ